MTYALNEAHALYPFLHELIGVKNGALVSLKTARTFTADAAATYGTGAYGEHFKSLANGNTPRGVSISPAVSLSTVTYPNMTLVVVVNSFGTAAGGGNIFKSGSQTPSINAFSGTLGATSGYVRFGNLGSVTITGASPRFLSLVRVGETSYEVRADGALSASGTGLAYATPGAAWDYLGGYQGFGSVTAEFVWAAWFTKTLTTTELSDLQASLGANNTFALIQSASDTTPPSLTSPTATATGATTASGSVSTNEANGTLYYLASANATELAATVKAGSSKTVTAVGAQSVAITGLTAATPYYPHYLHRDAAGNDSAVASGAQFTTSAAGDTTVPTLTGTVTFASITQTSYTAQWPAGLDNVAVTGYEYQIGSTAGSWTDAGNNLSAAITGRTAGVTETVYARAYDAAGLRSTPAISGSVTLESIPASGINVAEPLKNNTGTVLVSQSGVRVAVLKAADLVSVYETSGLTTNASGILSTISDAGITAGQQYHVAIKLADGGVGITGPITAS